MDCFAANDLAAFSELGASETTTAGRFDPAYTSKAMLLNGADTIRTATFINPTTGASTSLTDVWLHFEMWNGTTGAGSGTVLEMLNAAGTAVVRVTAANSQQYKVQFWNGAAWVDATANTAASGNSVRLAIDIHIVCGASGSAALYQNNSLSVSGSITSASTDNIASVRFRGWALSVGSAISQVLVSDQPTIAAKVASLVPNANGANTAWTGDYTGIAKIGYDDTTMISSATLGDKETYLASDATLPANYVVSSVFFGARARKSSSSPTNITPVMRIGGTDYPLGYSFQNLNAVSFEPAVAAFQTDPSTALAWNGITNVNAAEVGYQATA